MTRPVEFGSVEFGPAVALPAVGVHELVARHAARRPDAIAVRSGDGTLTYAELDRRADRLAHTLRGHGVRAEVPVAMLLDRGPDALVAMLAVLKAGGFYVPLDPDHPRDRRDFMVNDSTVAVVVAHRALAGLAPAGPAVVIVDEPGEQEEPDVDGPPDGAVHLDNLAYLMYTSGSTGRPKGVQVTHRGVLRLVHRSGFADLDDRQVFLLLTSLCFDVSTFEIWGALANGATLAVLPPGQPTAAGIRAAVRAFGVTVVWLSSGLFAHVVNADVTALAGVRQVIAGGDVVPPAQARRVVEELDATMSNGYGPTECTTFACVLRDVSAADTADRIPIGPPIANTHVAVVDADGGPLPRGARGELLLGGAGVARGYHGRPGLTADRFVPDPTGDGRRAYRTGDEALLRSGGVVEFFGRLDRQVKIRGYRVELDEIEHVLAGHPAVRAAAVTAHGSDLDRVLAAHVEGDPDAVDVADLRAYLDERLPGYMVPDRWSHTAALPVTTNGKVDRAALALPHRAAASSGAPRTAAEKMVTRVWQEVLDRDDVGVADHFFTELGGHSLLATEVVALLAEECTAQLPVSAVFAAPTVEQFAVVVEDAVLRHVGAREGTP